MAQTDNIYKLMEMNTALRTKAKWHSQNMNTKIDPHSQAQTLTIIRVHENLGISSPHLREWYFTEWRDER